jgi:anti-anti-sigma factor
MPMNGLCDTCAWALFLRAVKTRGKQRVRSNQQADRLGFTGIEGITEFAMGVVLEGSETEKVVRLDGAIDIACAVELKTLLLEVLNSGAPVRVSLETASYLDSTAMQLLWAAGQQARKAGVEFQISGQVPEPISTALADAGLEPFSASALAGPMRGV